MILDTDNAGNLIVKPNGQDGAVILAMKDGKQVRYEERNGKIRVIELPALPGIDAVQNN